MSSYTNTTALRRQELRRLTQMLFALVSRDIRVRYRRTFLGPVWAILQPLMLMVVFTGLSGVLDIDSGDTPYIIFSYSALLPWTFFTNSINKAGPSILSNSSIIKKTRIPREAFPLISILTAAFDTLMAGLVLVVLMLAYQVPLTLALLWLPVLFLLTALLAAGVGMFFAALGVYRRDFLQTAPFALQLWLYATPIIYPLSQVPERWLDLYRLNPMVGLIEGFRSVLARGENPDVSLLVWSLPATLIIFVVGWVVFRYMARYFADVL